LSLRRGYCDVAADIVEGRGGLCLMVEGLSDRPLGFRRVRLAEGRRGFAETEQRGEKYAE
jgi:hypothetical protein